MLLSYLLVSYQSLPWRDWHITPENKFTEEAC